MFGIEGLHKSFWANLILADIGPNHFFLQEPQIEHFFLKERFIVQRNGYMTKVKSHHYVLQSLFEKKYYYDEYLTTFKGKYF
jgi:hypothetical protein